MCLKFGIEDMLACMHCSLCMPLYMYIVHPQLTLKRSFKNVCTRRYAKYIIYEFSYMLACINFIGMLCVSLYDLVLCIYSMLVCTDATDYFNIPYLLISFNMYL
jgi:hypothetical protein